MPTIVASGDAPNLVVNPHSPDRAPDPTPRHFLTFLTDSGAVHTIVVDVEHAALDAEALLKWFQHTRAGVELSSTVPTSPLHRTVERVLKDADEAIGFIAHVAADLGGGSTQQGQGGAF